MVTQFYVTTETLENEVRDLKEQVKNFNNN